jgi:hypothetical protein
MAMAKNNTAVIALNGSGTAEPYLFLYTTCHRPEVLGLSALSFLYHIYRHALGCKIQTKAIFLNISQHVLIYF